MSVDYQYSVSANITAQSVNIDTLHNDITNNLTLSVAQFRGLNKYGDALYVGFTQSIQPSEKTALDAIVLNHNSASVPAKTRHLPFYPNPKDITNTYYTTTGSVIYPGSTPSVSITEIELISMMTAGATSYDVQIINRANNTVIAEQNFTNTTSQLQKFTSVNMANIPQQQAAIEILARINKNGNAIKTVRIDQVVFWLD